MNRYITTCAVLSLCIANIAFCAIDRKMFINKSNRLVQAYVKTWGLGGVGGTLDSIEQTSNILLPGESVVLTYNDPTPKVSTIGFKYVSPGYATWAPVMQYNNSGINNFNIYVLESDGRINMDKKNISSIKENNVPSTKNYIGIKKIINKSGVPIVVVLKTWGNATIGGVSNALEYRSQKIIKDGEDTTINFFDPSLMISEIRFEYQRTNWMPISLFAINGINENNTYTLNVGGQVTMFNDPAIKPFRK